MLAVTAAVVACVFVIPLAILQAVSNNRVWRSSSGPRLQVCLITGLLTTKLANHLLHYISSIEGQGIPKQGIKKLLHTWLLLTAWRMASGMTNTQATTAAVTATVDLTGGEPVRFCKQLFTDFPWFDFSENCGNTHVAKEYNVEELNKQFTSPFRTDRQFRTLLLNNGRYEGRNKFCNYSLDHLKSVQIQSDPIRSDPLHSYHIQCFFLRENFLGLPKNWVCRVFG